MGLYNMNSWKHKETALWSLSFTLCWGLNASSELFLWFIFSSSLRLNVRVSCVGVLLSHCDDLTRSCAFHKFMCLQLCHVWPLLSFSLSQMRWLWCVTFPTLGSISWQIVPVNIMRFYILTLQDVIRNIKRIVSIPQIFFSPERFSHDLRTNIHRII